MRVLLDTHVWLWMSLSPGRIAPAARALLADAGTDRLLSLASVWEIVIKYSTGKLPLPAVPAEFVTQRLHSTAVRPLAIEVAHVLRVADLPALHKDPFDRLIAAQALVEDIALVTHDRKFAPYGIQVLPA